MANPNQNDPNKKTGTPAAPTMPVNETDEQRRQREDDERRRTEHDAGIDRK